MLSVTLQVHKKSVASINYCKKIKRNKEVSYDQKDTSYGQLEASLSHFFTKYSKMRMHQIKDTIDSSISTSKKSESLNKSKIF